MQQRPQGAPGGSATESGAGLPIGTGLRIPMGVGFLAVGIIQGIGVLRVEEMAGLSTILDGVGFFLLAGTGVTMLMDRFYSLYLLLLWAVLGVIASFMAPGSVALPSLFARIMVALVSLAAVGQKGAQQRTASPL